VNGLNSQGIVGQRVGILRYIYYSTPQECNYGYLTVPTVFNFKIILGMPNTDMLP
jgi:hypothetical protein